MEEYELSVRRPEVVERLATLLVLMVTFSENPEYEAAKDEQAFVEGQIQILKQNSLCRNRDSDVVTRRSVIGKTVVVQEVGTTTKDTYHIVGAAGADIFSGKITNEPDCLKP